MVWKACSTLIASFALVSKYGMSFLEWHHCCARLVDTALLSRSILLPSTTKGKLSGSRGLAWSDKTSQYREAAVVSSHLDEELVSPAVQRFEGVGRRHVVSENTAVSPAVESHPQGLESLLARGVPDLHGDQPVVHHHLLGQEVRPDGGFVLVWEFLVDVLVHEGGLPHPGVTEDDHLEENLLSTGHGCWVLVEMLFVMII